MKLLTVLVGNDHYNLAFQQTVAAEMYKDGDLSLQTALIYKKRFMEGLYATVHVIVVHVDDVTKMSTVELNEFAAHPEKKKIIINAAQPASEGDQYDH